MKRRLSHAFRWLVMLFMGGCLTYFVIRTGLLPMCSGVLSLLMHWHLSVESVVGILVYLFFTSVTLGATFAFVFVVVFSVRELFRWKIEDEFQEEQAERAKLAKLNTELEAMHTAFVTYWGEVPPSVDPEMWKMSGRWDGTKWPDPPLSPMKRWRLIRRIKRLNKLRDKILSKKTSLASGR